VCVYTHTNTNPVKIATEKCQKQTVKTPEQQHTLNKTYAFISVTNLSIITNNNKRHTICTNNHYADVTITYISDVPYIS
jgi:hypothetical protein